MRPKGHKQQDLLESSLDCRFLGPTLLGHSLWDWTLKSAFFTSPLEIQICPPKYAASCVFDQIPQKQALKGKGGLLMQGFRRKVLPRKVHRKWGSRRERKEPGKGVGSEEVLQMWGLQPDPTRAPESSKGLQPPQVFQGSTS